MPMDRNQTNDHAPMNFSNFNKCKEFNLHFYSIVKEIPETSLNCF